MPHRTTTAKAIGASSTSTTNRHHTRSVVPTADADSRAGEVHHTLQYLTAQTNSHSLLQPASATWPSVVVVLPTGQALHVSVLLSVALYVPTAHFTQAGVSRLLSKKWPLAQTVHTALVVPASAVAVVVPAGQAVQRVSGSPAVGRLPPAPK
jgi:hypothetical protein